ncbi:MAG: hypothetical protein AAB874_02575 [Patescibacteria group bacterium]
MKKVVILFLFFFVACELVLPIFYNRITPEVGRFAVEIMLDEQKKNELLSVRPHPYTLYTNTPGWEKDGYVQNNSLGYRGKEIKFEPDPQKIRILTLGESTTLSYPYVKNPEDTWSAQLEKFLNEEMQFKVEVVNGGLNYATSAELLSHYLYKDRYLKPNFVIIHIGYNDVVPLLFSNYTPDYSHYRTSWNDGELRTRPFEKLFLNFTTVKILYAWWFKQFSLQYVLGQKEDWYTLDPKESAQNLSLNTPVGFRRNLELLIRNIKDDGAEPILFPVVFSSRDLLEKNKTIGSYLMNYYDLLHAGLINNVEVMKDIAQSTDSKFVQIPEGTIPVSDFLDHVHLNESGETAKAAFLKDYLKGVIKSKLK